jgi:sugar O-acyltransferase (sialic acid O-acetyltransferase NeuD family)
MTQDLLIVGSGGFARETAAAVHAVNAATPTWRLRGFLDDDASLHGQRRVGLTVLGGLDTVVDWPEAMLVVCVGNPRDFSIRQWLVRRLDLPAHRYATIVHPSAALAADATVAPGSVLLAHCTITAAATVGAHVAVMPQTVITHDDVVEDYATLASGVRLGGNVLVRTGAYLGAGALIRESVQIGAWAQVGMGSVVLRDVPADQVWLGNPARYHREVQLPERPPADLSQGSVTP